MFVVFEGVDGAGKGTQIDKCCAYLDRHNINHIRTREPGGTFGAEAIRNLLVSGEVDRFDGMSELLMMYAARHLHVKNIIQPALADGKWVICDRFFDSTLTYQGIAGGLGLDVVRPMQQMAVGKTVPDVTFLLDLREDAGLQRAEKRGGAARFEKKDAGFHRDVRDGFLALAAEDPKRIMVIDAENTFDAVWQQIEDVMQARFKL